MTRQEDISWKATGSNPGAKDFFRKTSEKVSLQDHLVVAFVYYLSVSCIIIYTPAVNMWQVLTKFR